MLIVKAVALMGTRQFSWTLPGQNVCSISNALFPAQDVNNLQILVSVLGKVYLSYFLQIHAYVPENRAVWSSDKDTKAAWVSHAINPCSFLHIHDRGTSWLTGIV